MIECQDWTAQDPGGKDQGPVEEWDHAHPEPHNPTYLAYHSHLRGWDSDWEQDGDEGTVEEEGGACHHLTRDNE